MALLFYLGAELENNLLKKLIVYIFSDSSNNEQGTDRGNDDY